LPEGIVAPLLRSIQVGIDPGSNGVGRCERVAPNAENAPALTTQQPRDESVTGDIAGDFLPPILGVSAWHTTVPRAAMPEAAINKDSQSLQTENEVGSAWERLVAAPSGNLNSPQN
jgi:hypothetical protein